MEVAGLPDWQTDMYNPDFAAIGKAMGMAVFTIESPDEAETTHINTKTNDCRHVEY